MTKRSIFNRLREVGLRIHQAFCSPYFGFVQGHGYLEPEEKERISQLVGIEDPLLVEDFERQFAQLIGPGEAVSFAAARMGFYELMRLQKIGKGDEVILLGATCSVMVNAVMRLGAVPVFSDIDPETFGSSSEAIAVSVTHKTRMIVAQHSFGIPCDIEPIVHFAKQNNIFLLEDCALTLGSEVNGVPVGNFGDAALFSTDHSKPLNTLIGGIVYSRDPMIAQKLRAAQSFCSELSAERQKALWQRLLLEARYCVPARCGKLGLINMYTSIRRKLIYAEADFLIDDCGVPSATSYPYPAKFPAFLAALGLAEIRRWPQVVSARSATLANLVNVLEESQSVTQLSPVYKNKQLKIVPLRLVWSEPDGAKIRDSIKHYIDVSWTWFMEPIIATKEPLENFGYQRGSCPVSEGIGSCMVNIPCNINEEFVNKLGSLIRKRNT